jgi:hypothetical protein
MRERWDNRIMQMEWIQVTVIVGANITIFLGFMGSVIALHLQTNKKIDAMHKDTHEEMKDFHGRLCAIEERRNRIIMGEK